MGLPVVKTGNAALDRFLDGVRRKLDLGDSSIAAAVDARLKAIGLRSGRPGAVVVQGANGKYDLVEFEKLTQDVLTSRLARDLVQPIDTTGIQQQIDAMRSRVDQVKSELLNNISGTHTGLINEMADRTIAIAEEALARSDEIAQEAHERLLGVTAAANAALDAALAVDAERADRIGAVAVARSDLTTLINDGDSAEATQRGLLAAQLRGGYTGTDLSMVTTGLIYDERTARVTNDLALAEQITLLSAGAGEQFDWKRIWYFDAGIESWTGSSAPTATAGWLRPANGAPLVTSPTGLAIDGPQYAQIRFRVRKYGTLTWSGSIAWNGGSTTVAEPTYDSNGIGLVTVSPAWTGTIDYISIQAYTTQAAGNYCELDWVAVGRPSPGASSAQLLEEQIARAAADSAEATSRETLSTKLTGLTDPSAATLASLSSGLMYDERQARSTADSAQVTSINSLQASFTTLDGEVNTLQSNVTTINDVIADLDSTIATSVTEVLSVDRRPIDDALDQNAEAILNDAIATNRERNQRIDAVAIARTELTTRIDEGLLAEATARLLLSADLDDVSADLITEQTARATADTAIVSSITALTSRVDDTEADILTEQTTRATADTALASDLTLLTARVDDTEADILTEQTTRANADTAISASVTTLTARVGTAETDIAAVEISASAVADRATGLEAKYTVKVMAGGAVAGYGLAIDANNSTPVSAFIVAADRFAVVKPDGSGVSKVPFAIDTGTNKIAFTADVLIDGNLVVTGTITNAGLAGGITYDKIASIDADTIVTGTLDADTVDVVGTLTAANINTSGQLRSTSRTNPAASGSYYASIIGENSSTAAGINEMGVIGVTTSGTGVHGWSQSTGGYGVHGVGGAAGVYGNAGSLTGVGVYATHYAGNIALQIAGQMKWGSYTWGSPSGSGLFLRDDGIWAAPASGVSLGSSAGAALASSGAAGSASTAARSDHVHPFPTAANVGAATMTDVNSAINSNNTAFVLPNFAAIGHGHSGVYEPVDANIVRYSTITSGSPGTSFTHTLYFTAGGVTVRIPCFYP